MFVHDVLVFRHCERNEAIHRARKNGLLRRFTPRNDASGRRYGLPQNKGLREIIAQPLL
jgi:hypothetical protein